MKVDPSLLPFRDVVIVGAGPSGLGCAIALKQCGVQNLVVLDRDGVGASFERWPAQMRLITPSFHSNPYGQIDLNAITPHTSPADFLRTEHPSGIEYAGYLQAAANYYEVPVEEGVEVTSLQRNSGEFRVVHSAGEYRAKFVIWATGEFSYPDDGGIGGSEHCVHNARVDDWSELPGVEHAVIGGFESGIDAAVHLARAGKSVHVLSRGEPWHQDHTDPSRTLSPYTRDRLKAALREASGSVRFYKDADIEEVRREENDYVLVDGEGTTFEISSPPILCTGFRGGLGPVEEYFTDEDGKLSFTEEADESPQVEGLFYSGPQLTHRGSLFCFIYKFRGRFGVIAREIADRLDLPWEEPLKAWQERGFMIDDLECCTDCRCAVEAEEEEAPAEVETLAEGKRVAETPS
ncbi:MAG: NAD(P)/FAD-dependent oxidoreductase [Verrucomicrobiota bacterium]